jgi:F0F1-type ATP synthase membrane subunit b/b'
MPWAAKMTSEHWLKEIKAGRTDYEALFEEAKKAHRNFSSDAAEIGKNVHAYAEAILKGLACTSL